MPDIKDKIKELEDNLTPSECIDEIVECLDSLYAIDLGNGIKKLPKELSEYSGYISIAYKQAKLLQAKLK